MPLVGVQARARHRLPLPGERGVLVRDRPEAQCCGLEWPCVALLPPGQARGAPRARCCRRCGPARFLATRLSPPEWGAQAAGASCGRPAPLGVQAGGRPQLAGGVTGRRRRGVRLLDCPLPLTYPGPSLGNVRRVAAPRLRVGVERRRFVAASPQRHAQLHTTENSVGARYSTLCRSGPQFLYTVSRVIFLSSTLLYIFYYS